MNRSTCTRWFSQKAYQSCHSFLLSLPFLHDHLTVIQAYSLAYQRRGNLELAKLGLRGVTVLAASGDTGIQGAAQQGGPPPRCAPFAAAPRHSKDGYDCFFGQLRDRFFKDQFVFLVSQLVICYCMFQYLLYIFTTYIIYIWYVYIYIIRCHL